MARIVLSCIFVLAAACCDDASPALDMGMLDASPDMSSMDGGVDASPPIDGSADAAPPIDAGGTFAFEEPPIDPGVPVRFATASFGPHPSQLMDIWLPESDAPTAVVIFYHGGGFVGGTRTSAHAGEASFLRSVLDAGMAWVGIDYRFVTDGSSGGVIGALRDSQRGLQFVRFHADELNIDPARVGLTGGSAGAGTALWLATHDDMADPESEDPVERMSTRVSAVTVWETQATYDLLRWATDVYSPTYPITPEELLANVGTAAQAAIFYGLPVSFATDPEGLLAEMQTEELSEYRAEVDMLAWMSSDDPPIYVYNRRDNAAPGASGFDLLHHPLHAMALRARAEEVSVQFDGLIPAFDVMADIGTVAHLEMWLAP